MPEVVRKISKGLSIMLRLVEIDSDKLKVLANQFTLHDAGNCRRFPNIELENVENRRYQADYIGQLCLVKIIGMIGQFDIINQILR